MVESQRPMWFRQVHRSWSMHRTTRSRCRRSFPICPSIHCNWCWARRSNTRLRGHRLHVACFCRRKASPPIPVQSHLRASHRVSVASWRSAEWRGATSRWFGLECWWCSKRSRVTGPDDRFPIFDSRWLLPVSDSGFLSGHGGISPAFRYQHMAQWDALANELADASVWAGALLACEPMKRTSRNPSKKKSLQRLVRTALRCWDTDKGWCAIAELQMRGSPRTLASAKRLARSASWRRRSLGLYIASQLTQRKGALEQRVRRGRNAQAPAGRPARSTP